MTEREVFGITTNFVQGWNFSGNGTKFSSEGQVVIEEGEWEGPIRGVDMFKKIPF
jgi:hypothetical protein